MERDMNSGRTVSTRPLNKMASKVLLTMLIVIVTFFTGMVIADYVIPPQKVTIINANLMRFELTSSTIPRLSYNLTFTMSIRNGVWYDTADYQRMEVDFYYNMEQFDSVKLQDFMLKPRRTRLFNFSRSGNSTISVGSSVGIDDGFRRSNETGFFDIKIGLNGIRAQMTDHTIVERLSYQCKLNLQLITSQNSSTQGSFKPVKCYDQSDA